MTFAPATLAALKTAATVASVVGSAVQAVSSYQTGKANQKVANMQADQARQEAQRKADIRAREADIRMGQMRVRAARSGIDLSSGSFLDIAAENQANAELDRLTLLRGGNIEAENRLFAGRAAKAEGTAGLVSGLLGSAAKATALIPDPPKPEEDKNAKNFI